MRVLTVFVLIFSMCAIHLSARAKDDKKKTASEMAAISGGIIYSLPRTVIHIDIDAEQEILIHGPYYAFAQKYLGINDAPRGDEENWTILKAGMDTYGEPDPAAVYKALGNTATLLSLSEDGVMLGINSEFKPEPGKVVPSIVYASPSSKPEGWTNLSMRTFLSEKDTTTKTGNKIKSLEEKAAEAASDILKYRKRKASLLGAKDDKFMPDGKAYEEMCSELDRIIRNYEELFVGRKVRRQHHFSFDVVPEGKNGKAMVAFRFSPTAGVLPASNVSGKPVMLELEPNNDLKQKIEAAVSQEVTTKGIYFRIPVVTQARLLNGSDVLAQAKMTIAQFGIITALSDGLLNGDYSIEFYPTTGAIRRIGAL